MARSASNVKGSKTIKFHGLKVSASMPDDQQLAKINQFTRRPFAADELYIGQLRLANNCIDRDGERFSEEVIQRFSETAVRKTMLFDHNRQSQQSAIGKYFDVVIEKMPLQQAIAETGEDLKLPAGITEVQFLSPSFYIPRAGVDEEMIVKIDAGIYDFASIGFRCEALVPVFDGQGNMLYEEYRGAGNNTEMTEGSLVYLGAQYGMAVKSAEEDKSHNSFVPGSLEEDKTFNPFIPGSLEEDKSHNPFVPGSLEEDKSHNPFVPGSLVPGSLEEDKALRENPFIPRDEE